MTTLNRFIGSTRSIITLLTIIACLPAAAGSQEQAPVAAPAAETQQAAAAPADSAAPATADQPGTYTIKQGDTLWDISSAHYRDPFLWPLIWQSNPSIDNPDLIYPGNALVIPSLAPVERAMSSPQETPEPVEKSAPAVASAPPQEKIAPAAPSFFGQKVIETTAPEAPAQAPGSRLVGPESAQTPIIDRYAMISAGFISDDEDSKDVVIGSVDDTAVGFHGQNIHATGQMVYIEVTSRPQVSIGELFLVYAPVHKVRHPKTNERFGTLYKVNGVVKVTSAHENGIYTAEIILSYDAVMKRDMLRPFQEPELLYPSKEKRTKSIAGYILDVPDRATISAQGHNVYLDKGKADGVEPGDRFSVYTGETNESGVPQYLGTVFVILTRDRTATAVIQKNISEMTTGDRLEYTN